MLYYQGIPVEMQDQYDIITDFRMSDVFSSVGTIYLDYALGLYLDMPPLGWVTNNRLYIQGQIYETVMNRADCRRLQLRLREYTYQELEAVLVDYSDGLLTLSPEISTVVTPTTPKSVVFVY